MEIISVLYCIMLQYDRNKISNTRCQWGSNPGTCTLVLEAEAIATTPPGNHLGGRHIVDSFLKYIRNNQIHGKGIATYNIVPKKECPNCNKTFLLALMDV